MLNTDVERYSIEVKSNLIATFGFTLNWDLQAMTNMASVRGYMDFGAVQRVQNFFNKSFVVLLHKRTVKNLYEGIIVLRSETTTEGYSFIIHNG